MSTLPPSRPDDEPRDDAAAEEYPAVPAREHVNQGEAGTELAGEPPLEPGEPAPGALESPEPEPALEPTEPEPELEPAEPESVLAEVPATAEEPAPPRLVEPEAPTDDDGAAQAAALADAEATAYPDGLEFGEAPVAAPLATPTPAAAESPATPVEPIPLAAPASGIAVASLGDAPRPRHNRAFGVGIAFLSSLVFAALYVAAVYLLLGYRSTAAEFPDALERVLRSDVLITPVVAFVVLAVLAALLANRARWWAHALLSLILGVLVYGVAVAVSLLVSHIITLTPEDARPVLAAALGRPEFIAAGILAREVALWFGLATSARGRRVVARNTREREDWERADAEARGADAGLA